MLSVRYIVIPFSSPPLEERDLPSSNTTTVLEPIMLTIVHDLKGIVHLNIIFSYIKVNKKCNLDHPVY